MKLVFSDFLPLIIGSSLSIVLGSSVWPVFYFVFTFIGGSITLGILLEKKLKIMDIGRRITILLLAPIFIIFFWNNAA